MGSGIDNIKDNLEKACQDGGSSILLINDMAGYGKVALSVMIPMLSSMRLNVYNLPTALVSNTLDYGKFDILETTDYMRNAIRVWDDLGFSFDAIATGFLVSEEQSILVSDYCRRRKEQGTPIFVDPIMGDEGVLYNGVTDSSVRHMRNMCSVADIIMPNVTEAQFLTDLYVGKEVLAKSELLHISEKLHSKGAQSVVITSAALKLSDSGGGESNEGEDIAHVTLVSEAGTVTLLPYVEIPVRMPGTGDIFSSMLIGRYMNGASLVDSVQAAMDTVSQMLGLCKDNEDKYKGIPIEQYLEMISL